MSHSLAMHYNGLVSRSPLSNEHLIHHGHQSFVVRADASRGPVEQLELSHLVYISRLRGVCITDNNDYIPLGPCILGNGGGIKMIFSS